MNIDWHVITAVDCHGLGETRLQAHYAAQWLARAARAYVPPRPDDSHTNLGWDGALGGFVTHAFRDGSRLSLAIGRLELMLAGSSGASEVFPLDGRTDADALMWIGQKIATKSLDPEALDAPSPYEMPAHALAQGAPYTVQKIADPLHQLADWYSNANCVLGRVREALIARGLDAPPVRCWPHHFDLDTLVQVDKSRTFGVGFSPGDEYYMEPYFYMSIYPEPDVSMLPKLPSIGHWHEHEFTAAVVTASRIAGAQDQAAETEQTLLAAIDIGLKAMAA